MNSKIIRFSIRLTICLGFFILFSLFNPTVVEAACPTRCPFSFSRIKVCGDWYNVGCGYCSDKCSMLRRKCCTYCRFGRVVGQAPSSSTCARWSSCYCSSPKALIYRDSSCGGSGCTSCQMKQIREWVAPCQYTRVCFLQSRCVSDSSCRGSCNCGSWISGSCGGGSCPSFQRYKYRNCYWSCTGSWCARETDCVADNACVPSPITPIPPSLPDCGRTCLNHGTAGVGWPDCSCTNRTPASGYTRIGTWNSRDCSQCTGYRKTSSPPPNTPTPTNPPALPTNTPTPTPTPTPVPSCSVSLSPNSLSLIVGSSDLVTANVTVQNATIDRTDFSTSDSGIASIDPSSDSSSPYRTQATGESEGSAQINASVSLNPSGSCSTGTPTSVTVEAGGWFQTEGGTIHAEGNLSNNIPSTAADKNMSIVQDGFPGVISHQSTTDADFGEGYPSNDDANHWLAKSSYQGKSFSSWTFFEKKYAAEMQTEDFTGTLPNKDGIYYSGSGKTLQGNWNVPANRWLLILVDGDISVPSNISVSNGSFLGIVSSGDINFGNTTSQVEGMFIAGSTINTGDTNTQFQAEGFFAASQFLLGRDLGGSNPTTPAELFTFRPDFLINSYKDTDYNLWWLEFKWEEIAP